MGRFTDQLKAGFNRTRTKEETFLDLVSVFMGDQIHKFTKTVKANGIPNQVKVSPNDATVIIPYIGNWCKVIIEEERTDGKIDFSWLEIE